MALCGPTTNTTVRYLAKNKLEKDGDKDDW